ncbi:hypothetical protein [Klebsiella pneumoniae]|uniref:hypothetical protein n=1 Tax=Klebsiella pneumoniae TaxID=573 RepID=UPI00398EA079
MKKLLLFFIFFFSFPSLAVDRTIINNINQSFVDYMAQHYRNSGMSESLINKKSIETLKEFERISNNVTLPKNLIFNGLKTPLGLILRASPIIMGATVLYESCELVCEYFGSTQKPNEAVTPENPALVTFSKSTGFTTDLCESNKVVIQKKDTTAGIPEVTGWSIMPCYKPKGNLGRDQYVSNKVEPGLTNWLGCGAVQEVPKQNFILGGVLHQNENLYYHTRCSSLPQGVAPSGDKLIIGGLDSVVANDPDLLNQKVSTRDVAKGLLSFYQSNWGTNTSGFDMNDSSNPLAKGKVFPNITLPSSSTTVGELLKQPAPVQEGSVVPNPTPGVEVETDGNGNYTNVSFPTYQFDDMPNDNVLLVIYNVVDDFISEHSWKVVKTGICPVIDFNVFDIRIHATQHCEILEFLRPIFGLIMMMIGGFTSIFIVLRS